ncbi:perlucin-like protein [Saccostrea cucullata]|uniref:perlucin-like protein n=1 Tax=Saccostrea cuccullata TaxID=36930 RepID=UPI002ED5383F
MVGSSEISEARYWSYFEMFVGCPADWEEYAMNCYGFFKDKKDWNTAKMYCESVDARLVAIDNEEENNWIFDRMKYHKDEVNDWWTEGSDEGSEGTWYWHHSNSRMIYTDWNLYLGEPNGKQRANCLLLRLELKWIDCPCSYESKFICEK